MEEFDFVVVGGGPGGCVSASRLTEDPNVSAVLIEAGPDRRGLLADCLPVGTLLLAPRKSSNNWGFETVPQAGLNGRCGYHPLGRGLGGGSSINTLMYIRGHRTDYDEWAAMGNPGWDYADVLPYFKKSENNQVYHNEYHGTDGPMWVDDLRTDNPYHTVVKQACAEAGLPFNPDVNGAHQEGLTSSQVMMKNGERWHTGKAYIHPHLGVRHNLHMVVDTECTRVLFDGKRAVGVEVVNNGIRREIRARREVIIAGGGILSAEIRQLSGVGPGQGLSALGILVVHDLPGVGRNLMDHLDIILAYHIPGDANLLGISPTTGFALLKSIRRYRNERRGMLATNFAELTGFMRLSPDSPKPEIQYEFVIAIALDHGRKIVARHGMTTHVLLLHPKSRGTVKLASADYTQPPLIDFNYLSHSDDVATLTEGAQRTAKIFDTPTFKHRVKADLLTAHCRTDADWQAVIRDRAGTNYHPVGTCRMGQGCDAVVDARLRVHGMERLRIVDSSIMPKICGGNTMAATLMIGEKGADMIKEDWK